MVPTLLLVAHGFIFLFLCVCVCARVHLEKCQKEEGRGDREQGGCRDRGEKLCVVSVCSLPCCVQVHEKAAMLDTLAAAMKKCNNGGRPSATDAEFLNRLAAVFAFCDVPVCKKAAHTGLSQSRLRDMKKRPEKKPKKKRSDAVSDADVAAVERWLEDHCRASPDETNTSMNKLRGPHLVFHKNFSDAEGCEIFKKANPEWRFSKSTFDKMTRSVHWLKKPRRSNCLCQPCTNMTLCLESVASLQRSFGLFDTVTTSKSSFVENLCCRIPDDQPMGQRGLILPGCSDSSCNACSGGGDHLLEITDTLSMIGEGHQPTVKQWMKVEKVAQDGKRFYATEKKMLRFSCMDDYLRDFKHKSISHRLHHHQWKFQGMSNKLNQREVEDKKLPFVFNCFCDISENCSLQHCAAPQSTHWGSTSTSILTAVGFHWEPGLREPKKLELFVLTESLLHDSNMTGRGQKLIEEHVASLFPKLRVFRQWMDNAPQHYRTNRHLSAAADRVAEDKIERDVIFHGNYHGKTVGDSAGGSLKGWLDTLSNRMEIRKVVDICDYINANYKPSKKSYKVSHRRAIPMSKRAAMHLPVNLRQHRQLKKFFHYNFRWDAVNLRPTARRRCMFCLCRQCHAGRCAMCENAGVGSVHELH